MPPDASGSKGAMLVYTLLLALTVILLGLVVIVVARPLFASYEAWIEAGVLGVYSIPAALVLSAASAPASRIYGRTRKTVPMLLLYLGNVALVSVAAVLVTDGILSVWIRLR